MKISDLTTILNEVSMSPSSLQSMASKVDAKVGIEFEMYVPDVKTVGNSDDEDEWIDIDDERVTDIDDVVRFFWNGGDTGGSHGQKVQFRDQLESEYKEWVEEKAEDEWQLYGEEHLKEHIKHELDDSDVIEKMKEDGTITDEELAFYESLGGVIHISRVNIDDPVVHRKYNEFLPKFSSAEDDLAEERATDSWFLKDRTYDEARENYIENEFSELSERDFFEDKYGRYASDFRYLAEEHDMYWPQESNPNYDEGGDADEISDYEVENVANEFEKITGYDTRYSSDYHVRSRGDYWVVEPDGSLDERREPEDHGLEFVSPPMSLSEMTQALADVRKFASNMSCYTDDSCGLHINVSVPNMDNLDVFKLLVFLGDKYVLREYGRGLSIYCKSAYQKMAANSKNLKAEQLEYFLQKVNDTASRKMQTEIIDTLMNGIKGQKYVSTNLHMDGDNVEYIEFRSPGGDWINHAETGNLIQNTINRFVVAMDIACDPSRYKQEYAKKLYKAIGRGQEDLLSELLSKKMSGTLSQSELKSALSKMSSNRLESGGSKPVLLRVYSTSTGDPRMPYTLDVIAKNKKEALLIAYKEWKIEESTNLSLEDAVRQAQLEVRVLNMKPPVDYPKVSRPEGLTPAWYLVRDTSYTHPPVLSKAYTLPEARYYACLNHRELIPVKFRLDATLASPTNPPNWFVYEVGNVSRNWKIPHDTKESSIAYVKNNILTNILATGLRHINDIQLDAVQMSAPIEG